MPHDSSAPSARLGDRIMSVGLHLTPAAAPVTKPGETAIILGAMPSGRPVILTVTTLEWLDDLETAIQEARAAGIVEAGMKAAVPA